MNTRNTHNSQPGALNAFSFLPAYEGNPPRSDTPLVCTVAPANPSSSLLIPMPNTVLQNQPSPTFLAGVTKAIKQELWAEQTVSLPASTSLASVSMVSISGGVPAQPTSLSQLDSQALSLAASGIGLSSLPPATATAPAPGGPNFFCSYIGVDFFNSWIPSLVHSSSTSTFNAAIPLSAGGRYVFGSGACSTSASHGWPWFLPSICKTCQPDCCWEVHRSCFP